MYALKSVELRRVKFVQDRQRFYLQAVDTMTLFDLESFASSAVEQARELATYKQGKGSVQFPLDTPLPLSLIRKMVQFNVQAISKSAPKNDRVKTVQPKHRVYTMSFVSVYPLYVAKAGKKGRTKAEVDTVICWLTGYSQGGLKAQIKAKTDLETFLKKAPKLNPARKLITGVVCGVRVEDLKEPTMQGIRYLDKLVDELAKGRPLEKILRT